MSNYNTDQVRSTLIYIKNRFGSEAFINQEHFLDLFTEFAPELKSEASMLERLSKTGILNQFLTVDKNDEKQKKSVFSGAKSKLTDEEFIRPEIADLYLNILADVFDWNMSSQNDPSVSSAKMTAVSMSADNLQKQKTELSETPGQKNTIVIRCKRCGTIINGNFTECPECGAQLDGNSKIIKHETSRPNRINQIPSGKKYIPVTQPKSDRPIIILTAFICCSVLIAGILWIVNSRKKSDMNTNENAAVNEAGQSQNSKNDITISISDTDSNNQVIIEAGHYTVNTLDYISGDNDLNISAEPEYIDAGETGIYTVVYTVSSENNTKTHEQVFLVQDTQAPVITLKESSVSVKAGSSYDPGSNIVSVEDENENSIEYASSADSRNGAYYTITGSVNLKTAGVYPLVVHAEDSSGNISEISFDVKVRSEERFVAIPSGCTSKRTDYDTLYKEMDQYGKEYTSPAYPTKDEMRVAIREFEKQKYPNIPCQVYPGLHITDGIEEQWIFYDYNPWGN